MISVYFLQLTDYAHYSGSIPALVWNCLNPIWQGLFLNRQSWRGGGRHEAPNHNSVVIALMIMKIGTGIKLDVFYATVTKPFVIPLLLRNYDVITLFWSTRRPKFQMLKTPKPLHWFDLNLVCRGILGCLFQISNQILCLKTLKFRYKETDVTITLENVKYPLTDSLLR